MLKNQRLSLALALALGTQQAFALGLGAIEVKSGLNQSLVAEIPVVSSRPGETENLKVSLASPEAFARIGVDRPAIMAANLKFTVERDGGGATVIRVTTPDKIKDPYLNFLLEVDTGRGRMLREYTVLLDPPVLNPVRSALMHVVRRPVPFDTYHTPNDLGTTLQPQALRLVSRALSAIIATVR